MAPTARRTAALLAVGILLSAAGVPVDAQSDQGRGGGQMRVQTFAELQTVDDSIATLAATPTSADPGPIAFDTSDPLRFNGRWTNTKHVVMLEVASATAGSGGATKSFQGSTHTIADWVHLRQDDAATFGTVEGTGTYDSDVSAYTAPAAFTMDSQGTLTLRTYPTSLPSSGGTSHTIHWIYDASSDHYWFDTVDADFTNGNGETRVYPVAHTLRNHYVFAVDGLSYGVHSVAGAAQQYVPTVRLAWFEHPGAANGHDFDVTVLFEFPAGAPRDTYDYTIQATIHALR